MLNPLGMVTKGYSGRLFVQVIALLVIGAIGAASVLYFGIQEDVPPAYSAALASIQRLKNTLAERTFLTYALFSVIIIAGVAVVNLFYSHRIAGPLVRLARDADKIRDGDLTAEVRFRKKDVTTPMADAMNQLTETYRARVREMRDDADRLVSLGHEVEQLIRSEKTGQDVQEIIGEMGTIMDRIGRVVGGLRL